MTLSRESAVPSPPSPRLRPCSASSLRHTLGLAESAHEWHHDLDVGQAHLVAHAPQRLALHRKRFPELGADVARGAAKTEHRVLFLGLVARAADQLAVFVALEIRQPHDHRLGPERGGDGRHALGHLVHIERTRRGMAPRHGLDGLLQVGIDVGIVQDRLRVNADVVVDDELQPRQAHALVGQLAEVEGQLRIADVHRDLDRDLRHFAALHLGHLGFQQPVIDEAGVALRAAHRHQRALLQPLGRVAAADHRRNPEFPGDDRRVAGAPAPVGDDRAGALHHRFPVRIGHVGHQHVAGLAPCPSR